MALDNNIVQSSYGKEIKDGIISSTISIEGFESLTDISSELATIQTGVYGQDIRVAIYNLLVKVYNFAMPWIGTKDEYDAIENKENNKLYVIIKEVSST